MIPEASFYDNLTLASSVKEIPGCIVECGVWRGGMSAGIASVLGTKRTYHLFDSFEGLPQASEIDGPSAIAWQNNSKSEAFFDNCSATPNYAEKAMQIAGAAKVNIVKGWFNQTLPQYHFEDEIALLRLDGDWYESTQDCLNNLYKLVTPGGLIIVDDYYDWDGCARALHDFLSKNNLTDRIKSIGRTCYLVRGKSIIKT